MVLDSLGNFSPEVGFPGILWICLCSGWLVSLGRFDASGL